MLGRAQLWQFLGTQPGRPYVPFPAQLHCLNTVQIPWPGLIADPKTRELRPYPTIYGVNCGRRFGKTTMAEAKAWEAFIAPADMFGPPTVRITADTEEHGRKIWDRFVWHAENTPLSALIAKHERDRRLITGKRGETIQLLSADNPQALSGDGVTCWLVDEAQYLSYPAWENLFPSTAERDGVIIMFGVSEGNGPFREVCYKGEDRASNPEFLRLCYPTAANPYVPRWRIEFARRHYTPTRFKQLYLAQWADDTGKIFRNVRGCLNGDVPQLHPKGWAYLTPPRPGKAVYGGIDVALLQDWCTYVLWDRDHRMVAWDRFNQGSWELLKARLFELSEWYNRPPTCFDTTGNGDPNFEDLLRRGMNVTGYKITSNEKKRQLIDKYAIRVGAGDVSYPNNPLWIQEHERFEATRNANSKIIQYSAPAGMTDDLVLGGAFGSWIVPQGPSPALRARMGDPMFFGDPDDEELQELVLAGGASDSPFARQRDAASYL